MDDIDVLGMKLEDGIKTLKEKGFNIHTLETRGTNQMFNQDLKIKRIIKAIYKETDVTLIVGDF